MKFSAWCLLLTVIFFACNNRENQTKEGLALARKKCSICHEFVEAGKLDRITWLNSVLPEMGKRANLNDKERDKIIEYYSMISPEQLTVPTPPEPVIRDNWLFEPIEPKEKLQANTTTTMVAVDTSKQIIYTSDAVKARLLRWNKNLEPIDTTYISSGISNAIFSGNEVVFTVIGDIRPAESTSGSLIKYNITGKPILKDTIASMLPRSVSSAAADFNNDGLIDYLTCGFGHEKGALFMSWQQPGNAYKKEELISTAGSTQIHVQDFNNDGWKDFMVLFSNAEESIRLFTNNKNGSFTMQRLINFLPVAGSTSFQVTDINNDGLPDIIYTSGDNSDLSKIFKPYHGLYIYINTGNFNYRQEYFFPINGCTKAIAADLDNDGDLDIATIAFFADLNNNPAEKCILFEQVEPMHFKPHSPRIDVMGRWLCMEVADYDNDGDKDIILGSFSRGFQNVPVIRNQWDKLTPFIVLNNTQKRLP
jgi:hypothetical protein